MLISQFRSVNQPSPDKHLEAADVAASILQGRWKSQVERIRATYQRTPGTSDDKKNAIKPMKKQLPAVTWSGKFHTRSNSGIELHSGLLCADLDELAQPHAVKESLKRSQHLWLVATSPSGAGLKAIFRVPASADGHAASFEAVRNHIGELAGPEAAAKVDVQCKDVSRLCFVTDDPQAVVNPSACEIEVSSCSPYSSALLHATSLHDYITTSQIRAENVLQNVIARNEAENSLQRDHGAIVALYKSLVEPWFQAAISKRNHFITQAVPFLFNVVAETLVVRLVEHFYDCNRALFNDSKDQHMNETRSMLNSVIQAYPGKLGETERAIYAALKPPEQAAFRICRDLALRPVEPGEDRQPMTFFMAFGHLGDRISVHSQQAQRLMVGLEGCQILKLVQKGIRRQRGVPGKGGTYLWLLPSESRIQWKDAA
ncbi:MAG TPA: BT4734/BF3469 family protein [Verrucomicrobiae bacterium]|nr:BT4734/BF3469 family protein [Verrucomicrobiae bacterium]